MGTVSLQSRSARTEDGYADPTRNPAGDGGRADLPVSGDRLVQVQQEDGRPRQPTGEQGHAGAASKSRLSTAIFHEIGGPGMFFSYWLKIFRLVLLYCEAVVCRRHVRRCEKGDACFLRKLMHFIKSGNL